MSIYYLLIYSNYRDFEHYASVLLCLAFLGLIDRSQFENIEYNDSELRKELVNFPARFGMEVISCSGRHILYVLLL